MNDKLTIRVLSIAAGVLFLTLLGGLLVQTKTIRLDTTTSVASLFEKDRLSSLVFKSASQSCVLLRSGDNWSITKGDRQFPADSHTVQSFFQALEKAVLLREPTSDKQKWDLFGVGEQAATSITFVMGDRSTTLILGRQEGPQEQYFRLSGSDQVRTVSANLAYYAQLGESYWSRLDLLPKTLVSTSIISVTVKGKAEIEGRLVNLDWALVQRADQTGRAVWTLQGQDAPLQNDAVMQYLGEISTIKADSFAWDVNHELAGISQASLVIGITNDQNKTWQIIVGKKADSEQWYLTSMDPAGNLEQYVWMVGSWKYRLLAREATSFARQ